MAMLAALFPPDHPYHWTTIGEVADLNAVQAGRGPRVLRAATTIRRTRRSRSRATSIRSEALALVRAYFEEIPAGETVEPVRAAAALDRDVRVQLEDRVELPRLYLAWLSPAMFARGRCRARSGGRPARQRQDVAAVSPAGVRGADRDRRVGVAEFPGDRRLSADRGHGRARATRWASWSAPSLEEIDRLGGRRPDRGRDRARPRAGGGAVHLPAPDRRRIRRQVRSAERVQRRSSATRRTSTAICSAISGDAASRCSRRSAVTSIRRGA